MKSQGNGNRFRKAQLIHNGRAGCPAGFLTPEAVGAPEAVWAGDGARSCPSWVDTRSEQRGELCIVMPELEMHLCGWGAQGR